VEIDAGISQEDLILEVVRYMDREERVFSTPRHEKRNRMFSSLLKIGPQ